MDDWKRDICLIGLYVQGGAAASEKQAAEGGQGGGRFRAIIDTVIGNLQLSITNVHIRFEVWPCVNKSSHLFTAALIMLMSSYCAGQCLCAWHAIGCWADN